MEPVEGAGLPVVLQINRREDSREAPGRESGRDTGAGLPEVESRKALDLYSIPSGGIPGSL